MKLKCKSNKSQDTMRLSNLFYTIAMRRFIFFLHLCTFPEESEQHWMVSLCKDFPIPSQSWVLQSWTPKWEHEGKVAVQGHTVIPAGNQDSNPDLCVSKTQVWLLRGLKTDNEKGTAGPRQLMSELPTKSSSLSPKLPGLRGAFP